ncbi:MAG: DeoR/GlpR transcriptional regulator [Salinivirgaceae bacterium]|nr:DeoR/GlpR transcriptional regulator [Salinivirgaceae bacterium]
MILSKRHQLILEKIQANSYVDVLDLCETFTVSAVTIRKDLKFLENKGLLFKTHGGASLENPYIMDRPVNEKEKLFIEEKNNIAKEAAKRISSNDSIIIASGTTVQYFSKAIIPNGKLTVVTSSLNVASELIKHKDIDVLQLGGYIRHGSSSVVGEYASNVLENTSCNTLFLGADGVDLDFGLSTTNQEEAALNKKMIKAANKTILLIDSSKFGKKSFGKICNLDQIDEIITDKKISQNLIKHIEEMGIKVTIA